MTLSCGWGGKLFAIVLKDTTTSGLLFLPKAWIHSFIQHFLFQNFPDRCVIRLSKWTRLVKNLSFIASVTHRKLKHNMFCFKFIYKSNKPHFLSVYQHNGPLATLGKHSKICQSQVGGEWFANFSSNTVLRISGVGNYFSKTIESVVCCLLTFRKDGESNW